MPPKFYMAFVSSQPPLSQSSFYPSICQKRSKCVVNSIFCLSSGSSNPGGKFPAQKLVNPACMLHGCRDRSHSDQLDVRSIVGIPGKEFLIKKRDVCPDSSCGSMRWPFWGWTPTFLGQGMDEWKVPWSTERRGWPRLPVLITWGYRSSLFRASFGSILWLASWLTGSYVTAYLFLKSISCCVDWLTEIFPQVHFIRKIARVVCKNSRK